MVALRQSKKTFERLKEQAIEDMRFPSTPSIIWSTVILPDHRPRMSAQEFQDHWINLHAVRYASRLKQLNQYLDKVSTYMMQMKKERRWDDMMMGPKVDSVMAPKAY